MKSNEKVMTALYLCICCFMNAASSQVSLPPFGLALLYPDNPTSADSLTISMTDRTCGGTVPYKGNPYRVSMSQNNITVILGEHAAGIFPLCPPAPREEIDIGRLPAGAYTISVIEGPSGLQPGPLISNVPFAVIDARASKATPYVRLDYSGHWWDPNDSGWGLFIWQDARAPRDSLLAAWFTYGTDGKAIWYTFQPVWSTATATAIGNLYQASRLPGTTSPPPPPTNAQIVGSAKLDFTHSTGSSVPDQGTITYTFDSPSGGVTLTRTIKRFQP